MAALNFPTSPSLGQGYTANGKTWVWDGTSWVSSNPVTVNGILLGDGTGTITAAVAETDYLSPQSIGVTVQGYDADIPTVAATQAAMEAGTETELRSMSPLRVKQAIEALAPPVTIADSTSIDLSLTGQQLSAAAIFGTTSGTVAEGNHTHTGVYQPYDANLPTWPSAVSATEVGYLDGVTSAIQTQLDGKASSSHTHSYQPLDADLTAIAGLAGTSGFLKKTAADTWSLDTSTYLTGNQSVTLSGDATGSGATAITVTLANSGATAGTYKSVTVDAKGRVTGGTNPTTLAGYGITDAASSSHTHGNITNAGAIGSTANLPVITTTSGVLTTGSFGTTANTFCVGNDSRLSDTRNTTNSITFNTSGGAAAGTSFNGSAAKTIDYTTVGAAAASHTHSYLPLAGGTLTGAVAVPSSGNTTGAATGINLQASGSGYIFGTTGDNASSTQANVKITSWWGLGFGPSISGQTVPQWENAVWIDCRVGDLTARGSINAQTGFKLNGAATAGQYLRGDGTKFVSSAIQASDIPTLNQNTTGSAGSVAWSGVTSKPTTVSGYGITNAALRGGSLGNTDFNAQRSLASGIYGVEGTNTNGPAVSAWSHFIQLRERGDTSAQLVIEYSTGRMYSRGIQTTTPTYSPWRTQIDDGNYNSYAPTLTGGGASGTWGISVTGSANSLNTSNNYTGQAFYAYNWWRSYNQTGWYNETYAVGIYATEAGNVRTYNGANFIAAGNVTAYSDIRLKENIEVIPDALEKVMALDGVTFTRNDLADTEKRHTGVIAQQVLAVLPEAVNLAREDDYYTVAYGNMVGLLIEAIKEQQKQIEELRRQVNG